MADNQMVKIVFDFDLGNVPASAKKLSQYLKDNSLDLKFTKASVDGLSASLNQLATAQTKAGAATAAAGNSVKKSNIQWTNLALVIQDLPYGFRGIQNNLPALIGGFAGMTGAIYLASSVIIALFTAWDNGIISFGKSSKMAEDYSKALATTYSTEIVKLKALYSISNDVTKSMGTRLEAAKALKEEYPGLLGKYSDEDIALGKAKSSYDKLTTTIINYARAKAAEGILTGLAAERLPLEIEATELLAKQRKAAGKDIEYTITSEGKRVKIGNLYNRLLKENAEEQAKVNKKAAPYVKILEDTAIAEIELEKFRAKAAKENASVGTLDDPSIKLLQAKQKYYKDDLLMAASYEQEILGKQRDLAVKQAELEKKSGTYIQTIRDTYNQLILNSQAETGRRIIEEQHKLGVEENKEHEKTAKEAQKIADKIAQIQIDNRLDIAHAILAINKQFAEDDLKNAILFAKNQTKIIETELGVQDKLNRNNLTNRIQFTEEALAKLVALAAYTFDPKVLAVYLDAIDKINAKLKGMGETWDTTANQIKGILEGVMADSITKFAENIGTALAGGKVDLFGGIGEMIADGAIAIGKALIAYGVALKAFEMAKLDPVLAIVAGAGLVIAGTVLKAKLAPKEKGGAMPFANGGIVSGPTMGLVGEYPGAKTNPEVIAPLDKLKDMIGGGGNGEFVLRGNDLVLALQRSNSSLNLRRGGI
jgi:hypothetical protein